MAQEVIWPLYDAHSHLHFPELSGLDFPQFLKSIEGVVVNGTHPRDWSAVAEMAQEYPGTVYPQFGVHPWEVKNLPSDWENQLRNLLSLFPEAGVGEVGLDKWVKEHDLVLQRDVFLRQIMIANELRRPITIHCLKAWGTLRDLLREHQITSPFLLHAYSGPADWIDELSQLGAYFSFSPYFLFERKVDRVLAFQRVPQERLLMETDAPAMLGPPFSWAEEQDRFSHQHQHPSNITRVYEEGAKAIGIPLDHLITLCEENFRSFTQPW